MSRKKRNDGLSKEVLAALRCSPNLEPCRKFRNADICKFMKHLNEGKVRPVPSIFRMLDREQQMMQFLREKRN